MLASDSKQNYDTEKNWIPSSLGFYIRDGVSVRLKGDEVEKVQSIFISRLVSNGLAAMTGLLAIDDEVLEVNSIDVTGKTLDQVHLSFSIQSKLFFLCRST